MQKPAVAPHTVAPYSDSFSMGNFVDFCYTRRLFLMAGAALFIAISALWTVVFHEPRFKSVGTIYVNLSSKSQSFSAAKMNSWVQEQEITNKIYLTEQLFNSDGFKHELLRLVFLQSDTCLSAECHAALEEFRKTLGSDKLRLSELEDIVNSHLSIFADSQKYMLTVTAESKDPKFSRALAKLSMMALIDANFAALTKSNTRVRIFLKSQTDQVEAQLSTMEQKLVRLQSQNGIMVSPDSETKLTNMYMDQKTKIDDLQREKSTLDLFLSALGKDQAEYKKSMSSLDQPSYMMLAQAQKRLDLLKYQISTSHQGRDPAGIGAGKPDVLLKELEDYRKLVDSGSQLLATDPLEYLKKVEGLWVETKQRRDRVASELSAAQSAMRPAHAHYLEMPEFFREISEVQRNIKISTDLYQSLRLRLQETNIQDAEKTNDLSILSLPDLPRMPAGMSPLNKTAIILLGGPIVSLGLLFLVFILVPLVHSPHELELFGIHIIGAWNKFASASGLFERGRFPVLLKEDPESYASNKVRETRLRLEKALNLKEHRERKGEGRVIGLASHASAEGKTFVGVNLAYGFSLADYRVVIVDLDWRDSDLQKYLKGFDSQALPVQEHAGGVSLQTHANTPNLHTVSINFGKNDPRDFLEGQKFAEILKQLRADYNLIIVDSPSLNGNVESLLSASISDAVILIVNQRTALKSEVEFSLKSLGEATSVPVLGLLNFAYDNIKDLRKSFQRAA